MSIEEALARRKGFFYEGLGFTRLDSHRTLRKGLPEVVYCPGKTVEQIVQIVARIRVREGRVLAARAAARVQIGESGQGGSGASELGVGGVRS
jgi:NCAIR mutase (PurE)-related protein